MSWLIYISIDTWRGQISTQFSHLQMIFIFSLFLVEFPLTIFFVVKYINFLFIYFFTLNEVSQVFRTPIFFHKKRGKFNKIAPSLPFFLPCFYYLLENLLLAMAFPLERVYHVLGIYTSSHTTHETHTYCQRRKKVRKALKLLPYRIIGHFKQNDELGFFFLLKQIHRIVF